MFGLTSCREREQQHVIHRAPGIIIVTGFLLGQFVHGILLRAVLGVGEADVANVEA